MKCNTPAVTERRIDGSWRFSNKPVSENVHHSRRRLTVLGDFRPDPSNRPSHALGPWRSESSARRFSGMRNLVMWVSLLSFVACVGCQGDDESMEAPRPASRKVKPQGVPQVAPPIDL